MLTKKLLIGGMNMDDSNTLLDPKEYVHSTNMRFATSENGKVGELQKIEGNVKKAYFYLNSANINSLPTGLNRTIGTYEETNKRRLYFFNYNSNGNHGIYCYDANIEAIYIVLLNTQVDGGLSFSADINSIAKLGDLLYWAVGTNEQRRVNVEAGIKLNHSYYSTTVLPYILDPLTNNKIAQSVISLIRNPPAIALTFVKSTDSNYNNNFIGGNAFQFAYRFVYRDYETSVLSPFSITCNYNANGQTDNKVTITMPLTQQIQQDVLGIDIIVKNLLDNKCSVIKSYNRTTDSATFAAHNAGTTAISLGFYNNIIGYSLDDATATKQFDAIPITSGALEIARNRLFLGNNYLGYDTPLTTTLTASATTLTSGATTTTADWWYIKYIFDYDSGGVPRYRIKFLLNITGLTSNNGFYYTNSYLPAGTWPNAGIYSPPPSNNQGNYPTTIDYSQFNTVDNYLGTSAISIMAWINLNGGGSWSGPGIDPITGLPLALQDLVDGTPINLTGNTSFNPVAQTVTVTNVPAATLSGIPLFKSNSSYKIGVVYYDYAGRKCGVITNNSLNIPTRDRRYDSPAYTNAIAWTISNTNIPYWAYYYSIVISKNQTTDFFLQFKSNDYGYVSKDDTGGYKINNVPYSSTYFGLAISLKSLYTDKLGYSYQEGDILKFYKYTGDAPVFLKVKDVYSNYVIVDLLDIGNLTSSTQINLCEIYSPSATSIDDYYYEQGNLYKITNPTLTNRAHSTTTGTLLGDIYATARYFNGVSFIVEAMSPNDLYWKNWNTPNGRVNIIVKEGQKIKRTNMVWSNVITLGTQNNGASSFDSLDFLDLPFEMNSIQRLMLASKIESEGTVMIAIGEQETISIYLGESQVFDNTGASFLAKSSGVVGNVNTLRGSFGTLHPESAIDYLGNVYFFDTLKGCLVSYDANGLSPISSFKMYNYFKKLGQNALAYKVNIGVDPYNGELLLQAPRINTAPLVSKLTDMYSSTNYNFTNSVPVTINVVPGRLYTISGLQGNYSIQYGDRTVYNDFVADYNTTILITGSTNNVFTLDEYVRNNYDGYDGIGGLVVYQLNMNRFTSIYNYVPEKMSIVKNRLVSFKDGYPWVHNNSAYCNFYNRDHDMSFTFVHSDTGIDIKEYESIGIEGDAPDIIHVRTENPNLQSSDIRSGTLNESSATNGDFSVREGINYAPILRDRLSPNVSGNYMDKLYKGDVMRGEVAKFQILYLANQSQKKCKFVDIRYNNSSGHNLQ